MDAYCEKQGISANSTRFMFEDKRLNPAQTAEQVFMAFFWQWIIIYFASLGWTGK